MTWNPIHPAPMKSARGRAVVVECVRLLTRSLRLGETPAGRVDSVRDRVRTLCTAIPGDHGLVTTLCCSVLCDLFAQGWRLRNRRGVLHVAPPVEASTPESRKEQVRAAHLLERNAQLALPASRKFIRDMENRHLYRGSWKSVFSVLRDGRDLAERLTRAASLDGDKRLAELRRCIDPYVQVVETDAVCEHTGLSLVNLWRYFRHTWTTPYFTTPGRKIWFLVRDRAAPNHPIIGIGALGSSIVQLRPRDTWIGWSPDSFVLSLAAEPTTRHARWLLSSLNTALGDVFVADFIKDGLLTRAELRRPTQRTILRLKRLSEKERRLHHLFPSRNEHKIATTRTARADWKAQATSHLFRSKRALLLARLLEARLELLDAGLVKGTAPALRQTMKSARARRAVRFVLRYVRSAHVGVDMMDITVCGAIAPYNAILGGKLVSLLMASPAVTAACERKYRRASSVIASSIAGRAVRRRSRIVLLGTTSLYDVAPSQYNRLRVPAEVAGGRLGDELQFIQLGKTVGFGSYHFSRDTMAALELVLARQGRGRRVNSIFGEGVNPKLRKVRTALDALGLPSDLLLRHGSPRVVYAVPLARNFRDVLLGLTRKPALIIPAREAATEAMVDYWRVRWLARRIERADVLDAVRRNTLAYPVTHGARVVVLATKSDYGPLFVRPLEEEQPVGALS